MITWSTDECLSVTRDSDLVKVQNCLIAEAPTSHALGSIIGSYEGSISFLNNLFACNRSRNPRVSGYQAEAGRESTTGPRVDFRRNVIFNSLAPQRKLAFTINEGATVEWLMTDNFSEGNPDAATQLDLLLVKPGAALIPRDP